MLMNNNSIRSPLEGIEKKIRRKRKRIMMIEKRNRKNILASQKSVGKSNSEKDGSGVAVLEHSGNARFDDEKQQKEEKNMNHPFHNDEDKESEDSDDEDLTDNPHHLVPVGVEHAFSSGYEFHPYYDYHGGGFVDEGTRLFMAIDPQTPNMKDMIVEDDNGDEEKRSLASPSEQQGFPLSSSSSSLKERSSSPLSPRLTKFDFPEDADRHAICGSIWQELVTRYKNAKLEAFVEERKSLLENRRRKSSGDSGGDNNNNNKHNNASSSKNADDDGNNCRYEAEEDPFHKSVVSITSTATAILLQCHKLLVQRPSNRVVVDVSLSRVWQKNNKKQQRKGNARGNGADDGDTTTVPPPPPPPEAKTPSPPPDLNTPLKYGQIHEAEVCKASRPPNPSYIQPSQRIIPPMGPPRHCRNGALQYPITFATPAINVHRKHLPKLWDISPFLLDRKDLKLNSTTKVMVKKKGNSTRPSFSNNIMKNSDHSELPISYDIENFRSRVTFRNEPYTFFDPQIHSNNNTIIYHDSENQSYYHHNPRGRAATEDFIRNWYWPNARRMLIFARRYLTAEAMAAYVLKTMGVDQRDLLLTGGERGREEEGERMMEKAKETKSTAVVRADEKYNPTSKMKKRKMQREDRRKCIAVDVRAFSSPLGMSGTICTTASSPASTASGFSSPSSHRTNARSTVALRSLTITLLCR